MADLDLGLLVVVLGALLLPLVLVPRLAALAAQLGIWISAKLAGRDALWGEDRTDEGRMARHGRARTTLAPRGKVFVSGELWNAEAVDAERPIAAGERVEVIARDGMLLRVRPARENGAAAPG